MMKLHSLEISGFKSFVDPVDVRFAGGITAIVGPNGCGKSNLAEAITWVLGEQSAKSLRGAKMEDVIFGGTDKRRPVGMAEVALTLATDADFAHAVDGKMEISRRVFREGGSQYRLNGKVVRLKEIKDLLMDTGLGIRAYSVIEQGKIGMILSGKPQERRRLLEEAAGITRYKARKRIAEVKLEEALGNLLRLDDIISEVERALRSLKRQASAARRYQQKEREYRDLLRQVLLGRWALLRHRLSELEDQLGGLTDREAERSALLHRTEADLAQGREKLDQLAARLAERHEEQAQLAATIEGRQEFLKGSRQRAGEMAERLTQGRDLAEQRRRQLEDYRHSLGNLDQRTRELLEERDEAARLVAEDDAAIAAAQKSVEEAAARVEGLRREMLGSVDQVNQVRAALQKEQVEIERRSYRHRFLEEERTRLERQLGESDSTLEMIDRRTGEMDVELDARTDERDRLAGALERLLEREAELGDEMRRLESELSNLRQRRRILVELSEEHAERRQSLIDQLAEVGLGEPRFLADLLQPVEGWEDGIDHFLGDLADAVVLDPGTDALELARALSRLDASGIFLRPLETAGAVAELDDPAISDSLVDALELPEDLARALPPAFLVRDAADAARLAAAHPGIAFISRERLWSQGGILRIQGEEAAPGVLARESELESLGRDIPELEERLDQATEDRKKVVEDRSRHASDIQRLDDRIGELRRELAVAKARRQDAAGRREKLRAEHKTVVDEQAEINDALTSRGARKSELGEELKAAEERHRGLEESFDRSQGEVEAAKEKRETIRTDGAGRRGRLELLDERLDSHQQEALRIRHQLTETEEQLTGWSEEEKAIERRRQELEEAMEKAEAELQEALDRRANVQEDVLRQQAHLDQRREALRDLEAKVQGLRDERDQLRSQIEQLRIDRASHRQDAEHLAVSYREEFRRLLPGSRGHIAPPPAPETTDEEGEEAQEETAQAADAAEQEAEQAAETPEDEQRPEDQGEAGEENAQGEEGQEEAQEDEEPEVLVEDDVELPDLQPAELADLEADLARCKRILERLGPVNVLAAQEYEEQQERHGFLTTQRKDVATSVESLKATIQEINQASSERFVETFHEVNRTFGEVFSRLFRGGEAEMRLFDEDDILETGIEIVARPPGKRLQNIMLLSGGEKALTAIALLFALFQAKPSPFCILDEVDAPLDDNNVLRFVDTLKELAQDTQFLVITHNKLTMEVASTLYGVTMEEKGVSKLVSVQLEEVQPVAQAATA